MLLSATCLSISLLFVKLSSFVLPYFFLVFVRFSVGLICLLSILYFSNSLKKAFYTTHFPFHFYRALAVTISHYCLFYYLSKSTLLNATVMMNLALFYIPVLDRIFLYYPIGKSTVIGIIISFVGVLFILEPRGDLFQWISIFGLLAGVFWAISQVIFGYNIKKEAHETSLLYLFLLSSILSFPALFFIPESFPIFESDTWLWILLFGLGVFSLLNQFLRGKAYSYGKPTTLIIFLYFSIILAGFFDWFVFDNKPNFLMYVGTVLVIIGAVLKIYLRSFFLKRK